MTPLQNAMINKIATSEFNAQGYYLPFMEGVDVWGGPYIFGCAEIRDENGNQVIF